MPRVTISRKSTFWQGWLLDPSRVRPFIYGPVLEEIHNICCVPCVNAYHRIISGKLHLLFVLAPTHILFVCNQLLPAITMYVMYIQYVVATKKRAYFKFQNVLT